MSRQRQRITRAVESRGHQVQSLTWEPIYNSGEMCGLAGGWSAVTEQPYHDLGYQELNALSTDELLAEIDYWLRPPEPCGCSAKHHPGNPLVGDPDAPVHGADCKYHIDYRLRWWKAAA